MQTKQHIPLSFFLVAICVWPSACTFKSYDYEKNEKAKVELRKGKGSIDVDPDRLVLKRKMKFPLF